MSTSDAHIPPLDTSILSREDYAVPLTASESREDEALMHVTRSAAFSSLRTRVQRALALSDADGGGNHEPSGYFLEFLSENISQLQDRFLEAFYHRLERQGVDTSIKLTLRLDDEARLVVSGDHPAQDQINELLSGDALLCSAFVEIAAQSAALRDLKSLRTLTLYDRAADGYSALAAGPGECIYQMSLKGEMNHFYFTR